MKTIPVLGSVFALTLGLALGACGSSSSGGGGAGSSDGGSTNQHGVGEHDSVKVSASTGGAVSGTGVTASIPAGALASDTTITVDIKDKSGYADPSDIAANVFEFGPNGTKFSKPVSMTLDLNGATAPTGKTAVIAYYDGTTWQALADSAVSGGKVTATTTHFTPFTIVWTAGGGQTGGGCASLDFTPCGGSLTGAWTFSAACADIASLQGQGSSCPQESVVATVDFTGSITFNADGSYSVSDTQTISVKYDAPLSCVDGGSCSAAGATDDGMGGCMATKMMGPTSSSETGTFTTSGSSFTTIKKGDGGSDTSTLSYCVSGTTLKAKELDSNGNTIIYAATKQ